MTKLIRNEAGQALPGVLILLLLSGLVMAPLLAHVSTGINAGRIHEERMAELYAADAGIEDALYKIVTGDASLPQSVGDNVTYSIANVNDKDVAIEVTKEYEWEYEGSTEDFLYGLTSEQKGSQAEHEDWFQFCTEIVDGTEPGQKKYIITITYQGDDDPKVIEGLGVWLAWPEGETDYYDYVDGSASGITDDYPPKELQVTHYEEGTVFRWLWAPPDPDWPSFTIGETKTQTFEFTPGEIPNFHFAWVEGRSEDIYISGNLGDFVIWKVTATATDSTTGKQTEVIAYVSQESDIVSVLTWEVSPQ